MKTTIRRSSGGSLGVLLLGVLVVSVGVGGIVDNGILSWGTLVVAIGLGVSYIALIGKGNGTCPLCITKLRWTTMPRSGSLVDCPNCRSYFRVQDGSLSEIPANYVSTIAAFEIPLEELVERNMPRVCCFCGMDANALVTIKSAAYADPSAVGIMQRGVGYTLAVPFCDLCSEGLVVKRDQGAGVDMNSGYWFNRAARIDRASSLRLDARQSLALKVSSYKFYRALCGRASS